VAADKLSTAAVFCVSGAETPRLTGTRFVSSTPVAGQSIVADRLTNHRDRVGHDDRAGHDARNGVSSRDNLPTCRLTGADPAIGDLRATGRSFV